MAGKSKSETMKEKIQTTPGSGNVFADIGLPNPEEELAKADLTIEIARIIKMRQMTPAQVSKRLHIDEADALDLIKVLPTSFSISCLQQYLATLAEAKPAAVALDQPVCA